MSIRNLNASNNKSWVNVKANTINANQINVINSLNLPVNGIIRLQGSDGTNGQIIKKDSSNNLAWENTTIFGSTVKTEATYTGVASTTASAVWAIVPGGDFTAPAEAGTYLFLYSGEMRNVTPNGGVAMKIVQQVPLIDLNEWSMDTTFGGTLNWQNCVGFKIITLVGAEVFKWYHKTDATGIAEATNLRGIFIRLS